MPESSIHDKCRPASNRLKKLQALRKQALQRRFGHASDARRLFVERAGGSAAKAAGRRRLAPVPSDQDWERLKDEEGRLNDALLDFHLDRLAVLSSVAGRVHAFSSLFFTRLMEGGCKQVSRWTRSLRQKVLGGIFSKEVIFVPAHDSNTEHWWLALIVYPWAAARITENGERLPSPSGCKAFIAFLDSIDPRLGTSFVDPEDEQAAQQAAACAQQRHEKALKLLREYLKHEWLTCFGGAGWDYCEDLIEGISLEVPQQTNTTDCGVYVLEYARRLLDDPRLLDHVCTHQASPPLLVAPVSRSLRQRWQKLGERLVADAAPRRKEQNDRSPASPVRLEMKANFDLTRDSPMQLEENLKILDFYLPRLAFNSSSGDRVLAFESDFYSHVIQEDWTKALNVSLEIRKDIAEGIFARDLIMVPSHDEKGHLFLALIVHPWAAAEMSEPMTEDTAFVAWLETAPTKVKGRSKFLEKFREYLKREWRECFGLENYDPKRVEEVILQVPKGDANPTMALLELAHRLLDPGSLDHLCNHQASPPALMAPLQLQQMKPADLLVPTE